MSRRERLLAADRQRRYRERAKLNIRLFKVACDEATFAALETAQLLHPALADNPKAIEAAVNAALREWESTVFRDALR